jgi:thiol peroxidase
MIRLHSRGFLVFAALFLFLGYGQAQADIDVDKGSVEPGTKVAFQGNPMGLSGNPISVGKVLPSVKVTDAMTMKDIDLSQEKGSVLLLSIVPSLDTKVCEAQTHYLGEEGDKLPQGVRRIVISRDTPFAQQRFANEGKLTDLQYLSDYKTGAFGQSTGLLVEGLMLLARTVIVVDKQGIVRHVQVVPELTHLPDLEQAFEKAADLAEK